jgi:hypothetical protein
MWFAVNLLCIPLCAWAGYFEMAPSRLRNENPDAVLCLITLFLMTIFPIVSVRMAGVESLRKPSLDRSPFNWGTDPLQNLFFSTVDSFALFVGSAVRLKDSPPTGHWLSVVFLCVAVGLSIGQLIVYVVYRNNIVDGRRRTG